MREALSVALRLSVCLSIRPTSKQIWGLKVKGQGQWERKCKNRFCAHHRQKWIDLRQNRTKMINGPFHCTHIVENISYITSGTVSFLWYLSVIIWEGGTSQRPLGHISSAGYYTAHYTTAVQRAVRALHCCCRLPTWELPPAARQILIDSAVAQIIIAAVDEHWRGW